MDQLLPILQFLVKQRAYLIAAAVLAAIVFVLRVMGAAAEIDLKYIMPIYLAGAFSALVLIAEQLINIPAMVADRMRMSANLATLSPHHRAILAYIKAQGHRSFYSENYVSLREMIPLGLMRSSDPRTSDLAPNVTFTVPTGVWKAINDPSWQSGPVPTSPPWAPEWMWEKLV
jgi:hypothetical protein